jgi:6-bladed beta-propeller
VYLTSSSARQMAALSTAATLCAASLACREGSTVPPSVEAVDSAGITIVINRGDAGERARWRTEPALTIGEVNGPDEYAFGRIADVDVNARGDLYVLDRQARLARVYGPDGRYRYRLGGTGEGPGELSEQVTTIRVDPSDSVAILDYWQRRLNVYAPTGDPARTVPLRLGHQGPYDFHRVGDGRLLVRWFTYNVNADGRFVPWDALLVSDGGESSFDTLMVFTYTPPTVGDMRGLLRPIFTNAAFYDVLADGRVIWSALEHDQLTIHDQHGSLHRIVRHEAWRRRALGADDRQALEAVYRAGADDPDAPLPDNIVFPDSIPTITAIRASPDGGFWVQRMGPLADTEPDALFFSGGLLGGSVWEVHDAAGAWYATVEVPRRFRVTRVRDSTVIGVQRDDLDVERVVVLRVLR